MSMDGKRERETGRIACPLCGDDTAGASGALCPDCATLTRLVRERPDLVRRVQAEERGEVELPDVLDAHRYRTVDRDGNKWYLSVSELNGRPVEVFASTAFDRDHELQSRIANLTTITRLLSMVLRHLSLGEPLTYEKCVKQVRRSSRQKNDLPDMLARVLGRYAADEGEEGREGAAGPVGALDRS